MSKKKNYVSVSITITGDNESTTTNHSIRGVEGSLKDILARYLDLVKELEDNNI